MSAITKAREHIDSAKMGMKVRPRTSIGRFEMQRKIEFAPKRKKIEKLVL